MIVWLALSGPLISAQNSTQNKTKKHNSFLKTLSHSKPKTENFCLAPISQNCAPHLSIQFFHFLRLVFSQACPLLSPFTQNIILSSYLHTHTHTECKRKDFGFFFSFSFSILRPPYPEDPSRLQIANW